MQIGDLIDRKYRLVRLLGEGGMGVVFEAVHEHLGQRFAIKFLRTQLAAEHEMTTRFLREARAAAAIGSEHIVFVTDVGQSDEGSLYLVMELLDGCDLGQLLTLESPLEPERAVRIILQVCEALQAAHDKGIVHRDLKPGNLFLVRSARHGEWVKVLDFGIAKFKEGATGLAGGLTRTGTTIGTPYYMAPEQFLQAKDVDERSDIYSVGAILYELLSGRPPFQADSYEKLVVLVATAEPPPLAGLRPSLEEGLCDAVAWCMAHDPARRPRSMSEVASALRPFAGGAGLPEPTRASLASGASSAPGRNAPPSAPAQSRVDRGHDPTLQQSVAAAVVSAAAPTALPRRRSSLLYAFVAMVAMLLAAGGIWAWTVSRPPPITTTSLRPATSPGPAGAHAGPAAHAPGQARDASAAALVVNAAGDASAAADGGLIFDVGVPEGGPFDEPSRRRHDEASSRGEGDRGDALVADQGAGARTAAADGGVEADAGAVSPRTSAPGDAGPQGIPSREAVNAVMTKAGGDAMICRRLVKARTRVDVSIVVESTGRIRSIDARGGRPEVNQCVRYAVTRARFPSFAAPSFSFVYPFVLAPTDPMESH